MKFRFAEAQDMPQVEALWDYCFEKREEPFFQYYFSQYSGKENRIYGAFLETPEGEKLQSMVHLNPYTVRINGQCIEIPYLVGVATAEEARGHHLMGEMLQHLWEEPEIASLPFVFLMPINAGIYLPYDFAFTHYRQEYKLPLKAVEPLKTKEGIVIEEETLGLASGALMASLYETFTKEYNGVNLRPSKQWQKLLTVCQQEDMQLAVAYKTSTSEMQATTTKNAVGYILYHKSDDGLEIFEMLFETTEVRNTLLKFAASKARKLQIEQIHWLAPKDDKTYLSFKDQANTGKLAPFMMFRVVNRKKAIELCCSSKMTVKQHDHGYDYSAIEKLENIVEAHIPEILHKVPLAPLAQLLMGTFTAGELGEEGLADNLSQEELQILNKLFPKKKNWINEYF